MTAVERLVEALQKHPEVPYSVEADWITVPAPSPTGFSVALSSGPEGFTVYFDGWHEEFTSEVGALNCFALGLSEQCRLKVYRRGNTDYRWTLEYRAGQQWAEGSTTGLLFFPFWRNRVTMYRQNSIVHSEHFPRIQPPQVAILHVDVRTGIVLSSTGLLGGGFFGTHLVFPSHEEAEQYARRKVDESPDIECVIIDSTGHEIAVVHVRGDRERGRP